MSSFGEGRGLIKFCASLRGMGVYPCHVNINFKSRADGRTYAQAPQCAARAWRPDIWHAVLCAQERIALRCVVLTSLSVRARLGCILIICMHSPPKRPRIYNAEYASNSAKKKKSSKIRKNYVTSVGRGRGGYYARSHRTQAGWCGEKEAKNWSRNFGTTP